MCIVCLSKCVCMHAWVSVCLCRAPVWGALLWRSLAWLGVWVRAKGRELWEGGGRPSSAPTAVANPSPFCFCCLGQAEPAGDWLASEGCRGALGGNFGRAHLFHKRQCYSSYAKALRQCNNACTPLLLNTTLKYSFWMGQGLTAGTSYWFGLRAWESLIYIVGGVVLLLWLICLGPM